MTRRPPAQLVEIQTLCRQLGLPMTAQRRAVLEVLVARKDHPTADQLFEEVRLRLPELSRTTVYRVLETLVRVGAVQKVSHPGSAVRYDAFTAPHHHLVCLRCERLLDVVDPALDDLRSPAQLPPGFEILDYSVHFRGVCSNCRQPASVRRRGAVKKIRPGRRKASSGAP